jgi:crotonobetaine/carnitine-CoA ligase
MTAVLDFLTARQSAYGEREVLRVDGVARRYDQLLSSVMSLAGGLALAGVGTADHVALMLDTSHAAVDAWLASAVLGCFDIPINTAYRGELLRYLIEDSEATVMICDARHLPTLLEIQLAQTKLRRLIVNGPHDSLPDVAGIEVCALSALYAEGSAIQSAPSGTGTVVLYTSGTTGASKGVMHSQESCLALADYVARVCRYTPDDALLNFFPLYHQNARYTGLMTAIAAGARFQLDSRLSTSQFWQRCRDDGITAFNYLGSVLTMINNGSAHLDAAAARGHSVRKAFGAGAPRGLWNDFEQRFGVELFEAYGLTEAPMVTVNTPPRSSPIGSAGRASELFEAQVLDACGGLIATGEVGEIAVRPKLPHGFMIGYYGRDADTLQATQNLWFRTGDRGWLSAEGDLYFEERATDSIRRRGENISAWEVESVLDRHPAVRESAVYGVASEDSEEEVMAALVLSEPVAELAQIIRESRADLPAYAVPRYVRALAEMPRTDTLKVQKAELRRQGVSADAVDLGNVASRRA